MKQQATAANKASTSKSGITPTNAKKEMEPPEEARKKSNVAVKSTKSPGVAVAAP